MTRAELQELRRLRRSVRAAKECIKRDGPRLETLESQAEEFIRTIDDPYIATIIKLRFVDGKRWYDVAMSVGSTTGDSVRMLCYRYLS